MMMLRSLIKSVAIGSTLIGLTLSLGGCFSEDHYANSDFITGDAGDSVALNTATQTVNPWPKNAQNTDLDTDGRRAALAMQRYQDGKITPPRGLNTTTGSVSSSNGDQLSATIQK